MINANNFTIENLEFVPFPTRCRRFYDRTGQRVGRLVFLGYAGKSYWYCRCDCGRITRTHANNIVTGDTQSCGCLWTETMVQHGEGSTSSRSPEFAAYLGAKTRCVNPNTPEWHNYGGRGIEFRFESFLDFLDALGRKPSPKHSVDRYPDKNGHYEVGNVRWATQKEQMRNTRQNRFLTLNETTRCVAEWAEVLNSSAPRIRSRLQLGWCDECALTLPINSSCPHRKKSV